MKTPDIATGTLEEIMTAYAASMKQAALDAIASLEIEVEVRPCVVCGTLIGIWKRGTHGSPRSSRGSRRTDVKFCGTNCRSKNHRDQRKQAKQAQGETGQGKRSHTKWCSKKCAVRAYRQRKREAIRLGEQGRTPASIAKELGSTTATVRGWLAAEDEKRW